VCEILPVSAAWRTSARRLSYGIDAVPLMAAGVI
jgi:hypothetical protein